MRVNEWIREWKSLQWDKEKLWESPCIGLWLNEVNGRMWFCHLLGGKAAEDWMDSPWLNKVKHILSPEPFLFRYDLTFFHSKKRRRRRKKNLYDLTLLNSVICKSRLNRHPSFPSKTLKQHSPELIFPYWTWFSGWMLISFAFALTVSLLTPAPVPSFTVNSFTLYGLILSPEPSPIFFHSDEGKLGDQLILLFLFLLSLGKLRMELKSKLGKLEDDSFTR